METILITGASRGIGLAVAKKFLAEGWFVVGTSTTDSIKGIDSENFIPIKLNLADPKSIEEASQNIKDLGKEIDVLINNAGVLHEKGNPVKIKIESLRSTLEVNVIGTIDFTEHIIPLIKSGGHIINMSSRMGSFETKELGVRSAGSYPAYRISKAALNMYTHALAGRLEQENIKVSSIEPGWVKTDMGGPYADRTPEYVGEDVYNLVQGDVESGNFWHQGKTRAW